MDVGDPTFIFTLTGTDVYGKKQQLMRRVVKFTKAEVEKQMKDDPGDPDRTGPVTFDDLGNMALIRVMKEV